MRARGRPTGRGRALPIACLLAHGLAAAATATEADRAAAAKIAEAMRAARQSDGFEVRVAATPWRPDGTPGLPVRWSLVGQTDAPHDRLRLRGIAPEAVRDRVLLAERDAAGRLHLRAFDAAGQPEAKAPNAQAGVFGTDLVLADLFTAWWSWPVQGLEGQGRIAGRDCTWVRSRLPAERAVRGDPVQEVDSCVDTQLDLALETSIFGAGHRLLRRLVVTRWFHAASGRGAARALRLTAGDGARTDLEVYGGDERYRIGPDTFAEPPRPGQAGRALAPAASPAAGN